jgi:predicted aminopeptidase
LLVLAVRNFAEDSLGLDAGKTYTTYAVVRRDTLVLVLSASRWDRLEEYRWRYPIVGPVPYKGFFRPERAVSAARRLEQAGFDTYLRVANAFSTLGWFEDPLLSTIVREDSADLAATVIHEILHRAIYVRGRTAFNESFANFVGYRGAEAYFRARGDQRNAERAAARWRDELRLGRFLATLAEQLENLYTAGIAGSALRGERARLFNAARSAMAATLGPTLETMDGRSLADRPMNNAVVLAQRLYLTDLDRFEEALAAHGGDLPGTIATVRRNAVAGDPP